MTEINPCPKCGGSWNGLTCSCGHDEQGLDKLFLNFDAKSFDNSLKNLSAKLKQVGRTLTFSLTFPIIALAALAGVISWGTAIVVMFVLLLLMK